MPAETQDSDFGFLVEAVAWAAVETVGPFAFARSVLLVALLSRQATK